MKIIYIENDQELEAIRYDHDDLRPDTFYVMDNGETFFYA